MPHLRGSGALGAPGLLGVGASSSLRQFARCELLELPDQTGAPLSYQACMVLAQSPVSLSFRGHSLWAEGKQPFLLRAEHPLGQLQAGQVEKTCGPLLLSHD